MRTRRAGFTLIELIAVLAILAILMAIFLPRLAGFGERARERTTRAFLHQLSAAIGEYEDRFGDYPPSQFQEKWGAPPNTTNLGAECLVLAMWSSEWTGAALPDDRFVNTDEDQAKKPLTRMAQPGLLELKDEWDNPIAYFHRRDYGRQDAYVVLRSDDEQASDCTVKARTNPVTRTWFNPEKFQLLSAGADGEFGTADDIGNFDDPESGG